jgi:predicted glycosyltransferase
LPQIILAGLIIIMRKKIARLPRQTQILPRPIVTFDNKEHSQSLLEPLARKYLTPDAFVKHAGILRASAA